MDTMTTMPQLAILATIPAKLALVLFDGPTAVRVVTPPNIDKF